MAELHDLTALEQGEAVRRREVSPRELVEHYLARVERLSDTVGAFVTVTDELARRQALLAESRAGEGGSLFGADQAGHLHKPAWSMVGQQIDQFLAIRSTA